MTEPETPLPPEKDPLAEASPGATTQLPTGLPQDSRSTVKMDLPPPPVLTDPGSAQRSGAPGEPPAPSAFGIRRLLGAAILLAALGGGAYLLFFRGTSASAPGPSASGPGAENLPPGVQAYLDQAKAGDAHAMRMLGVMYYYGLNVPQDREKGLYWYRQAADRGSDVARAELSKLQQGGSAK